MNAASGSAKCAPERAPAFLMSLSIASSISSRPPGLLACPLEPLAQLVRPVCCWLVFQQGPFVGQGEGEQVVAFVAGLRVDRRTQQRALGLPVHLYRVARTRPNVGTVGLEQVPARLAQEGEGGTRNGERLGEAPCRFSRSQVRESASQAASRLTRRPGLVTTKPQSRLATGLSQGPADRGPRDTEKGPSRLIRSGMGSPVAPGMPALCHRCAEREPGLRAPLPRVPSGLRRGRRLGGPSASC